MTELIAPLNEVIEAVLTELTRAQDRREKAIAADDDCAIFYSVGQVDALRKVLRLAKKMQKRERLKQTEAQP